MTSKKENEERNEEGKEERRNLTIKEVLDAISDFDLINNNECPVFKFIYDGNQTAGNGKRAARISIAMPKDIVNLDLRTLNNYFIIGMAIPKKLTKLGEDFRQFM